MTNSTLTAGTGHVFLSSGSAILTLYNVNSEVIKKSNGLIRIPFPTQDSNESILADLMGCSRDVVLEGHCSTGDVADLYKYVRDLASIKTVNAGTLITGDQSNTGNSQVGYIYTPIASNMSSTGMVASTETIRVYVNDVSVTYAGGDPNKVKYSLTSYEGSSTNSF